jgi:hypothetical protein
MSLKHPLNPPMTLGNMRQQGVHHLIALCHSDACRHQAPIDVSKYRLTRRFPGSDPRLNAASGPQVGGLARLPFWKQIATIYDDEAYGSISTDIFHLRWTSILIADGMGLFGLGGSR